MNTSSAINPPPVFNIQYPNSRTGMFSLRAPFKDSYGTNQSQRDLITRHAPSNVIHPEYLHQDQSKRLCSFFSLEVNSSRSTGLWV